MNGENFVKGFSKMEKWFKKNHTDDQKRLWFDFLADVSDDEFMETIDRVIKVSRYFPTPDQFLSYVIPAGWQSRTDGFRLIEGACEKCGKHGTVDNQEGLCRFCYTGLTNKEIQNKYRELFNILNLKDIESEISDEPPMPDEDSNFEDLPF